ncbi:MAG: hypothetical protein LC778_16060 [Acidobacteria bacterium]|nr:hypothetical protein [Acidobacteriota bacterium]
MNIAYEKYAEGIPDWFFIPLCVFVCCFWFYLIWTSKTAKKYRYLIYNYPIMSLMFMVVVGLLIGGGFGALLWWGIYKQPQSKPEITTVLTPPNIELKKQANQLSNEMLQFISDRRANEPKITWRHDEKMMRKKNGVETLNRNSAAFKRALEEWNRDNEESSKYSNKMRTDFVERFGVRYEIIIKELENRGAKLTTIDKIDAAQTNPIIMERAAIRLGVLANELPDN